MFFCVALLCTSSSVARSQAPPKPEAAKKAEVKEVEVTDEMRHRARARTLDLAHAIATAGNYKRRNNYWEGAIRGDDIIILPLQFFAGNDYYIALGTDGPTDAIAVTAFDTAGKVMPLVPDERDGRLMLNVKPKKSGAHFLRLRLRKGSTFAYGVLTYLYR